jgi:hypothetical protein
MARSFASTARVVPADAKIFELVTFVKVAKKEWSLNFYHFLRIR